MIIYFDIYVKKRLNHFQEFSDRSENLLFIKKK